MLVADVLSDSVGSVMSRIFDTCAQFIPYRSMVLHNGSHPWIDKACRKAIQRKCAAAGLPCYKQVAQKCSDVLMNAFKKFQQKIKFKLTDHSISSKNWWRVSKSLLNRGQADSSIPSLKDSHGKLILNSKKKANLFCNTLRERTC